MNRQPRIITERDCAGQAQLVRDVKKRLDKALSPDIGLPMMDEAKEAALALACEIESFQRLCARCPAGCSS